MLFNSLELMFPPSFNACAIFPGVNTSMKPADTLTTVPTQMKMIKTETCSMSVLGARPWLRGREGVWLVV